MERLKQILSQAKMWIDERDDYVKDHQLDPLIVLPRANWKNRHEYLKSQMLLDGDMNIINTLRYHAPATGYLLERLNPAKPPDIWFYKYVGATLFIPEQLKYSLPNMLGEKGWLYKGRIVNHDAYAYQERLNLLWESGIVNLLKEKSDVRIIEIGAGWGGLARHLKQIFPNAEYYIVDLPEMLPFAMMYLYLTLPHKTFNFVPNYKFREFSGKFDLVINTLSMNEMAVEQVKDYAIGIKELIGNDGLFFEQNQTPRPMQHIHKTYYCKDILKDYFPYRKTIQPRTLSLSHGIADIWANKEVDAVIGGNIPMLRFYMRASLIRWLIALRFPSSILTYICHTR